jgi:two-component system phosphate regulon sensor histidine kinase PhoR
MKRPAIRPWGVVILAIVLGAGTATLVGLGYKAMRDSQRSMRLLLEGRAAEHLALLYAGLVQDMKGAQTTVLVSMTADQLSADPPYDLADIFARTMARFSYPESFFTWRADPPRTYVFNRSGRPPSWHSPKPLRGPYPVTVSSDPQALEAVVRDARRHARFRRPYAVFATAIDGTSYQVVVKFFYGKRPGDLLGMAGFTVNLQWVRRLYFDEISTQIARIGGGTDEVALAISDERSELVSTTGPYATSQPAGERTFPLTFADPALLGPLLRGQPRPVTWTARSGIAARNGLASAATARTITFALISVAAIAMVFGLIATVRGVRMTAELAMMKSDFVSGVTHELKTPLALIQLVADTLASGRYQSPATIRDYAHLLANESRNLTRLIDDLLAYARLSDARNAYAFETLDVRDIIDESVDHFEALLLARGFTVEVDLPSDLPLVRADRAAVLQALQNLIDNAIKYSGDTRILQIHARAERRQVEVAIADHGSGIPQDELSQVCEKFYRGRDVKAGGSGLGLAIALQVAQAHGGRLNIVSTPGEGTRVEMTLPVAQPI